MLILCYLNLSVLPLFLKDWMNHLWSCETIMFTSWVFATNKNWLRPNYNGNFSWLLYLEFSVLLEDSTMASRIMSEQRNPTESVWSTKGKGFLHYILWQLHNISEKGLLKLWAIRRKGCTVCQVDILYNYLRL